MIIVIYINNQSMYCSITSYELLKDYILKYLPAERGYSKNTVLSYYTSIKQFIEYLKNELSMKREDITVYDFDRKNVGNYLK